MPSLQPAGGMAMFFIGLIKYKQKPTRAVVAENLKRRTAEMKEGVTYRGIYWTLGRYDAVALFEARDEKAAMKIAVRRGDIFTMETLVAIPLEEAEKLVE